MGGAPLFSGTLVDVTPALDDRRTVAVRCYSLPGVLQDCTAPASALPTLEYDNATLKTVAEGLVRPFGITAKFTAGVGTAFERVACPYDGKIFEFLAKLARDRGLVLSDTPEGALLFQQSMASGRSVAQLREGESPVLAVRPTFAPQEYYSDVTGVERITVGTRGGAHTEKNPHLPGVVRPFVFTLADTEGADTGTAVRAKLARMFANAIGYSVDLATWRDPAGALWAPNTTITLEAPGAMIYRPYKFLVRRVTLSRGSGERARLDLILPGTFEGKAPDTLPWD